MQLELKNVEDGDMRSLYEWRNHPSVRENCLNAEKVSLEQHQKWFKEVKQSLDIIIYIGFYKEKKIGVIRFEKGIENVKVSVMLNPYFMGQGLGSQLIVLGTKKFTDEEGVEKPVIAEIKEDNIASIKVFQRAGFKINHLTYIFDSKKGYYKVNANNS